MEVIFRNSTSVRQKHFRERKNKQSGFTLIELMVTMVVSGILLAAMVMAFTAQSRTYNTQEEVTTLQEDLRAALSLMSSEIRMATYNPTYGANVGITTATADEFRFAMDLNGDGNTGDTDDPNEDIRYGINSNGSLGRDTSGDSLTGLQPIAENIEQLAFEYLVDDSWIPSLTDTSPPVDTKKIRAVKICILGRTARQTSSTVDNSTFNPPLATPPSPLWTPASPGRYQWRMMSVVVQLRNQQG